MADLLQFTLFPPDHDEAPELTAETELPVQAPTALTSRPEARSAAVEEHAVPAPEAAGTPPDNAARERALDTQLSCIVEAPAGSGKTGLLLQRFLKLLAHGNVEEPEQVLAITFTRKATAELRERVLEQLQAAAAAKPLPSEASSFDRATRALAQAVLAADSRLHWNLLDQPHRLRIQTIDSLCAEIARSLPLLSGSGMSQPLEDARPLYREAARRTLLQLGGKDPILHDALRTVILHRDGNIQDCIRLLAGMLAERQQWGELVPLSEDTITDEHLDTQVRPRLERSLAAIVSAGLRRALDAFPAGALDELTTLAHDLASAPPYNGSPSPIALCRELPNAPRAIADDLPHWIALVHLVLKPSDGDWRVGLAGNTLGFEITKAEATALRAFIQRIQTDWLCDALCAVRDLPPARYPEDHWRVAKALFRLLRHALAELKVLFAESGQCDFPEVALAAAHALSSSNGAEDLANSPGAHLQHLLVDEMQDTSSSQYHLLDLLTRSWDSRSQTLFLVGDPKQSIYLFRQARVERFLRTVADRRLGEIELQPLQLTANFRSQAALVDGFNDTFARIFPSSPTKTADPAEAVDVPFVRAHAIRQPTSQVQPIHWHAHVLGDEFAPSTAPDSRRLKAARQRSEARAIRSIIEDWRARPLPSDRTKPWRIAVLARARSHFAAIAAELSGSTGRAPIPYRAIKIDALHDRPEVLDALALTRALVHPADRAAWLAVLRAPWCGLSLTDLLRLTGEDEGANHEPTVPELIESRADQLSPEGQQLLARAWPVLNEALNTFGRTPLATHIERTWRSLGGDAALSRERLTNVRSFLHVLHELERATAGRIDLNLLKTRLADLYAEPSHDEDAVEFLTIHNSKGLEFDLVLVPSLERKSDRSQSQLLNWLELDAHDTAAAHILLAPIWQRGDDRDALNRWLYKVRGEREHAEVRRLFYVACTRAREELHLFAACERRKDGSIADPGKDTLLAAAWPVIGAEFAAVQPQTPAASHTGVAKLYDFPSPKTPDDISADSGLALAAAADQPQPEASSASVVLRLPRDFEPLDRFNLSDHEKLPYTHASQLPHAPTFDRPEGSFAVRAFGNVVHRFLQIVSQTLERDNNPDALLHALASWEPRLRAALRGEGLAPSAAQLNAPRAIAALRNTLADPIGRWIVSPHSNASNERSMVSSAGELRSDRVFLAGPTPLSAGDTHLWIVDFKTTEQGARSRDLFEHGELLKYRAQLERYASVQRRTLDAIQLALYYPLIPHLIQWDAGADVGN